MGGMFGESKYDVLKKVPSRYSAATTFIKTPCGKKEIISKMEHQGLKLPVIFKPDLGERGFMVQRINTESDIENYLSRMKHPFVIQELVDLPLEFGVFYLRYPSQHRGQVTSLVMKEMLSVTGDGVSTLGMLIQRKDRAKLQWETLKKTYADDLHEIVPTGKIIELVSIGNHCLGTKFLDGSHLINDKLSTTFNSMIFTLPLYKSSSEAHLKSNLPKLKPSISLLISSNVVESLSLMR